MDFLNHYDYVILGEHPAGLWAARHLLSLEKKVLILPLGKESGLNAIPKRVASDFGWNEKDWVDRESDPIQILTPERRFKLHSNLERTVVEYEFQFGHRPIKGGPISSEILRGLAHLARGNETGPVFIDEFDLWLNRSLSTLYVEKENGFFIRRMLRHLSEMGAHISKPKQVKQVFIDKKSFVGVQLAGVSTLISAKAGLISTHFDHVKALMTASLPSVSEPVGWNFEMSFECSPEALPRGLSSRMLYVEKDAPVLEILREGAGQFRLKTALPLNDRVLERGHQRRLCERMLKVCEKIIPDLEYNLKAVVPDLRDPEKVEKVDLPALYPFTDLHRIPWERVFYSSLKGLGYQSSVANLYIASEESNPRSGLHGAYQAVIQSLEQINKKNQASNQVGPALLNDFN